MKEQDILSAVFEAVIKKNMLLKASSSSDVNGARNANARSRGRQRSAGSTSVDQGNTWIAELFSSDLADDVIDEALDDAFIPDISAIQDFVSNGGIEDLEEISLEPFSPQVNTVSSSTNDDDLSSSMTGILSRGSETPRNDLISSSSSPVPRLSPAQRLRKFYEYEELYKNDILILDADDDPLPFPS